MSMNLICQKLFHKKWLAYVCTALAAVTVLSLVFAGVSAFKQTSATPTLFDPINCEEGDYCYLNVTGLDSDWIARENNKYYYTVLDEDGYLEIAIISDATIKKMDQQIAYYNDESSEAISICLTGTTVKIVDELREVYADVYGVSESTIDNYFGYYYLDTTTGAIAKNSATWIWLLAALFSGLLCATFACAYFPMKKNFDRSMKYISDNYDADSCAVEVENMGNEKLYFGNNYLYCINNPFAIRYSEVQWAYVHINRVYGIKVSSVIKLRSHTLGDFIVNLPDKNGLYDSIFTKLQEVNPDVVIGYDYKYEQEFRKAKNNK